MPSIGVGRDSAVYRCWEGQCCLGFGRDSAVLVLGETVLSLRCWERQCCL